MQKERVFDPTMGKELTNDKYAQFTFSRTHSVYTHPNALRSGNGVSSYTLVDRAPLGAGSVESHQSRCPFCVAIVMFSWYQNRSVDGRREICKAPLVWFLLLSHHFLPSADVGHDLADVASTSWENTILPSIRSNVV